MDAYLEIAQRVLSAVKRPMTARGILDAAYKSQMVPEHLYGQSQHKTLQARLSEDILKHRASSAFFRTQPGYFFLTEFLTDASIPEKYRTPFPARRRTRDLQTEPALSVDLSVALELVRGPRRTWLEFFQHAARSNALRYIPANVKEPNAVSVWTFSVVRRGGDVLSYRIGPYRDGGDNISKRRSIGFPGLVGVGDRTLFSGDEFGIVENAMKSIIYDLDLSIHVFENPMRTHLPSPVFQTLAEDSAGKPVVLIILEWLCPEWFEPTTRRLSINDPQWLNLRQANNRDDFEPWSLVTTGMLEGRTPDSA